jgi:hypothetical protein
MPIPKFQNFGPGAALAAVSESPYPGKSGGAEFEDEFEFCTGEDGLGGVKVQTRVFDGLMVSRLSPVVGA